MLLLAVEHCGGQHGGEQLSINRHWKKMVCRHFYFHFLLLPPHNMIPASASSIADRAGYRFKNDDASKKYSKLKVLYFDYNHGKGSVFSTKKLSTAGIVWLEKCQCYFVLHYFVWYLKGMEYRYLALFTEFVWWDGGVLHSTQRVIGGGLVADVWTHTSNLITQKQIRQTTVCTDRLKDLISETNLICLFERSQSVGRLDKQMDR